MEAQWREALVAEYLREKGITYLRPSLRKQLDLIAQGKLANKDAAEASGISHMSVAAYRADLYDLLQVEGRDDIVQALLRIALTHLGSIRQ